MAVRTDPRRTERAEVLLDAAEWHERIVDGQSAQQVAERVRSGKPPAWLAPLLNRSRPGDVMAELGSGTGELSAFLAAAGRHPVLVDYSRPSLEFSRKVFSLLGLQGEFVEADILQGLPLAEGSADVIWSSGVLEHFSDEQIVGILRHSFRASRRTVMSLVPNARSLPYRLGKWIQESRGEWPWGHEDPKFSLASQFREAGLAGIREETIGAQHALNFLSGPDLHPMARALSAFYSQLPDGEADSLGQGYLLVTAGFVREPRRMAVIPSDPLDAYVAKGNSGWLQEYYNPTGVFEEVYCLSPVEPCQRWAFGMKVIPTQPHELPDRIRELRIDLVRCYGGFWPADMGCRNKIQGIPVVVSVHDTSEELLHDSIVDADHVIAVSAAVRGLLERRGVDPGRIHVLPNRVDVGVFRPLDRSLVEAEFTGRFPGKYHVLHVGRKSPEKNLETVIRALSILGPDYGALFIGQGDAAPYFDLAVSVGVADRCAFIPSVRNEQLPILFAYCDVLCTPSLREGFGMVFIEALSCGTPVVTSNIAPMTEYIRHGVNGLLVDDPRDASAVARAIRRICTDSELAQRLRIAGPESVTPFRKDQVDRREASLYRQFLEHRT